MNKSKKIVVTFISLIVVTAITISSICIRYNKNRIKKLDEELRNNILIEVQYDGFVDTIDDDYIDEIVFEYSYDNNMIDRSDLLTHCKRIRVIVSVTNNSEQCIDTVWVLSAKNDNFIVRDEILGADGLDILPGNTNYYYVYVYASQELNDEQIENAVKSSVLKFGYGVEDEMGRFIEDDSIWVSKIDIDESSFYEYPAP